MLKKIIILLLALLFISGNAMAQFDAYIVYEKGGDDEDFEELIDDALDADIILFGEQHNNPIAHWLQLELAKAIHEKIGDKLIIGAEMFERDDQLKIDEYFKDFITTSSFEKEARIWNNYKTDYKPVLEFAKENKLIYLATNIPRRYASYVAKNGLEALDSLAPESRNYYPPAPIAFDPELPAYKKMKEDMGGAMMHGSMPYIVEAQAVKDATMAETILNHYQKGSIVLHFNGAFHSDNFEGIYWYLKQQNPKLKIMTISTLVLEDIEDLPEENEEIADYIIAVPKTMTTTY